MALLASAPFNTRKQVGVFWELGSIQAIVTGENFNSESALKIELI